MDLEKSRQKVAALTAPRNAVLVGASDRPGSWSARVWRNLTRYEFPGPIYLVNPRRTALWDRPCYPDFKSLPEPPDHLVVLVPAPSVPDILRSGAAAGARSATVFSSGFGEAGDPEGAQHGRALALAIAETGLGVSGPNCMGNVCGKSRLVTLTEDRPLTLHAGPVALAGQSGGVVIHLNRAIEERGIAVEYLITSGNETGLTVADYIAFFAGEPELKVIGLYVEAIADIASFKAACRMARAAGKSIIALKLGQSEAGREAAMAHTGSLAGSAQAFDAVCGEIGVIRADTLDDMVEIAELLVHGSAPTGRRLGAMTLSGAFRGLLLDAAERNRLTFPPLAEATIAKLRSVLSVGSLIGNPIDGGFAALGSAETYMACLEALDADPSVDVVLMQETLPREPGSARSEKYIKLVCDYVTTRAKKPVAFVTLASHSQTDYSRALRAGTPRVALLQEANKALRAIARVVRRSELERLAQTALPSPSSALGDRMWRGASAPSPRLRGEGRGEGAAPQAQTRGEAPSPGAPERVDLTPHAERGEGQARHAIPRLEQEGAASPATLARARALAAAAAGNGPVPLNEAVSKDILRAYGFAVPDEALVGSPDEAVEAARRIGYPVVLKAVAAALTHKSDVGAVSLNLATASEVASAYARITKNLALHGFSQKLDGMLVARQVSGGLELALGLNRDPEVGLVAMAGSGGVLLELTRDVAFCAPPISRDKALDLLERTHAARLMRGYRGGPALDSNAAIEALIALGRLAVDLDDVIAAVDINPFVVLPQGGLALDALVVLRRLSPS
jgi:acyl-CoA synthetase (NDP forming)